MKSALYEVDADEQVFGTPGAVATVLCISAKDIVIAGGCGYDRSATIYTVLSAPYQAAGAQQSGWACSADATANTFVHKHVVCLRGQ